MFWIGRHVCWVLLRICFARVPACAVKDNHDGTFTKQEFYSKGCGAEAIPPDISGDCQKSPLQALVGIIMVDLPPAGGEYLQKAWYVQVVVVAPFAEHESLALGSVKANIYGQREIVAVDFYKLHKLLGPLRPNSSLFTLGELTDLWAHVGVAFISSLLEAKLPMMRSTAIENTVVRIS